MKNTILNTTEADIMETLQYKYGDVVTAGQIFTDFSDKYDQKYLKKIISNLSKKGWLVRLKKGTYLIADLQSRGFATASQYLIANTLVKESYVSFGLALQYYGMFDQMLSTITSVSLRRYDTAEIQNVKYRYVFTDEKYFFGWSLKRVAGNNIRIADKEKAIIDILQFHRNILSIDLVLEKLMSHKADFDFNLLIKYANRSNISTRKILGFLLDIVEVDTNLIGNSDSIAKMDSKSDRFNAKWRLYYDKYFDKYLQK